jgi:peptidoglycan/xylan/chitin deacetylase (PgdA/CDA1 family)
VTRRAWMLLRLALSVALVTASLSACTEPAPPVTPQPKLKMAITIDDVPLHHSLPPDETRLSIAQKVIAALQGSGVPAIGFVNGGFATNQDTRDALDLWASTFPIANHTWTHDNIDKMSVRTYEKRIAQGEPVLQKLSKDGDWRWFRYPFLAEGTDPARRAAVRTFLHDRGYRIAAVTVDSTDYAYNEQYALCVAHTDTDAIAAMEDDLLEAVRANTLASQQMSEALYGRQVPVVALLHLGGLDARVLPRILEMFRVMGYEFVPLAEAQADPAYAADNDPSLPARPQNFELQMQAKGLSRPPTRAPKVDLDTICREDKPRAGSASPSPRP